MIVAFLQNQWFKNPEAVKRIYDRHPEHRHVLNKKFLFMGCLTGKRIMQAFGKDLVDQIIWEEISPEVANESSGVFKPDYTHIEKVYEKFKPSIIITFGKVAQSAIKPSLDFKLLNAPHPAARINPMIELNKVANELRALLCQKS